jgi:hypothetical protein
MAIVLNQAAQISGRHEFKLPAIDLAKFLDRIPFRYPRFPAWFPGPGGATHPLAAYWGLRNYLHRANLRWKAVLSYRQTRTNLAEALKRDFPTLIYGVGSSGIPHVVVPVSKTEGEWQILDPGYPTNRNPIMWGEDQLSEWWTNFSFVYPRGTMIWLTPFHDSALRDQLQISPR